MNRDDIIRMAREASGGMLSYDAEGNWRLNETEVAHFAALVAAAEREACAKVCEENADDDSEGDWDNACNNCAYHIRARGKHE